MLALVSALSADAPQAGQPSPRSNLGTRPAQATAATPYQRREKYTRAAPSQAEQARRRAWGKTWGPLVGKTITDALRGH